MAKIDPTARIEDGAVIGDGTTIGPYCVIGPDAVIGAGCTLASHVSVSGHTTIGANCSIMPFAALGGPPQDLSYRGEPTRLQIGEGCTLREGVTMNVGTVKGGGLTRVGARGYFMNNAHIAHDCVVGNDVIFATSATLGGHCEIGDFAYIGGMSAVVQRLRVGPQAMVGGLSCVRGDVIPFGLVNGQIAMLERLNIVGMKRRNFTRQRLATVGAFYKKLFHGPGIFAERLDAVQPMALEDPAIAEILAFIGGDKHRPLCMPADAANAKRGAEAGMAAATADIVSPVGIVAGAGAMPFTVADQLAARGLGAVILALRGACDPVAVTRYRHHWVSVGQVGKMLKLFRSEGCRDVLFVGGISRPSLSEVRLDWGSLRLVAAAFRGGDDHLLSGVGRIFEQGGFRMIGVKDAAPDLLMPQGCITRATPDDTAAADIVLGQALLAAISPFDIGQAAIVIDGHVVAVEDIEGTDRLLVRVARLREAGRIRAKAGRGVLVKAPKQGQDLRYDLPAVGSRTVEGAARAGLAGIAIAAGNAVVADAQAMIEAADKAGLFVTGVSA